MKLSKLSIIGALAIVTTSLVAPAAQATTYPTEGSYFPACSGNILTDCYSNTQIKLPNTSSWTAPGDNVYFGINAFSLSSNPSLVIDVRIGDNQGDQNLAPTLPLGTEIKLDINTGDWHPNPQAHAVAVLNGFSQSQDNGGNWTTSVDFTTTNWSAASNCFLADSGGCANPGTASGSQSAFWHDYASLAQVVFWGVSTTASADDIAWWHKWDGMYTSSNASSGYDPYYDVDSASWVIEKAAPARTQDGTQTNWLTFNAFIPDHSVLEVYGINGVDAAPNFRVTRQNDGTTTQVPVTASIQHITDPNPGILISIPRYSFDLNPTALRVRGIRGIAAAAPSGKLRVKFVRPAPGKTHIRSKSLVDNFATFNVQAMSGATKYEASCKKGSTTKTATSTTTSISVTNLTEGTWSCKARAKNTSNGAWSTAVSVSVSFAPAVPAITGIELAGNFARISFTTDQNTTDVNAKCVKGSKTKTGLAMLAYGIAPVKISKGTWKCSVQAVRAYHGKTYLSAWSPATKIKK